MRSESWGKLEPINHEKMVSDGWEKYGMIYRRFIKYQCQKHGETQGIEIFNGYKEASIGCRSCMKKHEKHFGFSESELQMLKSIEATERYKRRSLKERESIDKKSWGRK